MPGLFMNWNPFERVAGNQMGMVGSNVSRGALIGFYYPVSHAIKPNIIHDPYPLVIVTDIWPRFLRGVNLHYLTFPYIKNILTTNCGNMNYSYYNVRPDKYVANAFRMYYRTGMSQVKKMDCDWLKRILLEVRSFSENEIDNVKQQIKDQIRRELQMKANDLRQQQEALSRSQQEQLRQKTQQVQDALQGGVQRNLIHPQQYGTGKAPANYEIPPGGPLSTDDLSGPNISPQQ